MLQSNFVASATVTVTPLMTAAVFAMPGVDGSNTDVMLTNNSNTAVALSFGTSPTLPIEFGKPSSITIPGGATLLTNVAAIAAAAAAAGKPQVLGGTIAATAATATYVACIGITTGSTLVIRRGTSTQAEVS